MKKSRERELARAGGLASAAAQVQLQTKKTRFELQITVVWSRSPVCLASLCAPTQPRPISAAIKSIIPERLKADKWDNLLWQKTRTAFSAGRRRQSVTNSIQRIVVGRFQILAGSGNI